MRAGLCALKRESPVLLSAGVQFANMVIHSQNLLQSGLLGFGDGASASAKPILCSGSSDYGWNTAPN
jgi:hypothetical protein